VAKKGNRWRPPPPTRPSAQRDPETGISNREARKLEARRQREALRRKAQRRKTMARVAGIAGAVVVVAGVVVAIILASGGGSGGNKASPADLPGIQKDDAPWPPESTHLQTRLKKIGIPFLGTEQLQFHIHQHLDLFVHDQPELVPANIGIISGSGLAVIHTHADDGVIHVESPTVTQYTLGEFFDVWGVLLTNNCMGAYCNNGTDQIRVFVNGKQFSGSPRDVPLKNLDEIVVTYGTPAELPKPIPKTCTLSSCVGVGFGSPSPTPSPSATAS
jgi:hypothetical protein